MRGTRGQQIGEYAVLLGIVGLAFVGSQMLMSRRVAGGLIAFSQTVLGTPDAPEGGSSGSTSNSTSTETGDPDRIRTVTSGSASGGSSAGHILAEAYGPYIGVRVMSDAYSSSTSDLSLNGFITDAITADPDWMVNAADGDYDIKAKDVNGDGARDVLVIDEETIGVTGEDLAYLPGASGDLPEGVLLSVDQLTEIAVGEDGEEAWAEALEASEAEPLVTWLSSAGLPGRMEEGFESGQYALPEKGKSQKELRKEQKELRKERSKAFMAKHSNKENRQYQAFRAFYMNLSELNGNAYSRDDSLEEKLDQVSGYDITTEMGEVDMKADLIAPEEDADKDPAEVLAEMLQEARDPNSELFARLENDGVFDIPGLAGTPQEKVEILDSEGKVVMFVAAGGTEWETGPDYAGEIQYKTIDIDGHKQSVPYGIRLEEGGGDRTGVSFGTFEADLENNAVTVDVMRKYECDFGEVDEDGNPTLNYSDEEILTTRRSLHGAYSEDGTEWNADTLIGVQEDPTVIPLVSHDSADRKPDAWLVKDTSLEEAVAQGDVPGSVAYLLVKDVNGNGRLDQADQDAVGSTPTFVHNDVNAVLPAKPGERETLKSDIPTGLEAMAAGMKPGENTLLYRRANPNQVPEEDRQQVDTGIVAGDLVQAMAPIRPNDFVNATPQFRLNTDVNALVKASTGATVDDAKIVELFQGGLSTALAGTEFSYEEQDGPVAQGDGPKRPQLSFAQRIGISTDFLRGILSISGERSGFTETDIDRALLGLDVDDTSSNFSITPRQP